MQTVFVYSLRILIVLLICWLLWKGLSSCGIISFDCETPDAAKEDIFESTTQGHVSSFKYSIDAIKYTTFIQLRDEPVSIYIPKEWKYIGRGFLEFHKNACPISNCFIIDDLLDTADIVFLKPEELTMPKERRKDQLWILELLESPQHTPNLSFLNEMINYTVSYRMDSDIIAPYGKFILYDAPKTEFLMDYSDRKTRKVAWFVSNCFTRNRRRDYANALAKFIQVDVYGNCGNGRISHAEGRRLIKEKYKFYLSFENSNCRDYVTEKFFENALLNNAIPVVYGAERSFYEKIAPPNSFIYAMDFNSPKELSQYLLYLDQNKTAYNEFFEWKQYGRVTLDTKFWCRVCAFVQNPHPKIYEDIHSWWHQKDDCQKVTGFHFTSQKL